MVQMYMEAGFLHTTRRGMRLRSLSSGIARFLIIFQQMKASFIMAAVFMFITIQTPFLKTALSGAIF